jgi:hypothetical protein
VLREARRFNIVCCGRRWGKTKMGVNRLIEPVLRGQPVGWFAPTYKVLDDAWEQAKEVFRPIITRKDETDHMLRMMTGGSVEMWSLENEDAGRSRKYARVIVDEAAMVAGLGETWEAAIRPTLADMRGDAYFLSTPKGYNFFRSMWLRGQDPLAFEWKSWQFPTASNPHIHAGEIEAARQELPDRLFRQEWLAEFIEDAGGVFRHVRRQATLKRVEPYDGVFVIGLDWAKQYDFTVLVVMDAQTRRVVDMDRFNKVDWVFQRERVKMMAAKWQAHQIVAESNSIGGPNIEALQREGLPVIAFETTASSKPPLIESLALAFEQGEIEILDDPVLVGELEAYERTVNAMTGRSRYSAPEGAHDDCVMSLALAWQGVAAGGPLFAWEMDAEDDADD